MQLQFRLCIECTFHRFEKMGASVRHFFIAKRKKQKLNVQQLIFIQIWQHNKSLMYWKKISGHVWKKPFFKITIHNNIETTISFLDLYNDEKVLVLIYGFPIKPFNKERRRFHLKCDWIIFYFIFEEKLMLANFLTLIFD